MKMFSTSKSAGNTDQMAMQSHLTPIGIFFIKTWNNNKLWEECGEKSTLVFLFMYFVGGNVSRYIIENDTKVSETFKNGISK